MKLITLRGAKGGIKKMKKTSKTNNQAIDSSELIVAMNDLEKENGINKD